MTWLENLLLGIVEGLTEYLPVSSTGHLMMASELMGLDPKSVDTYIISIQFGAILSVVWLYRDRFFKSISFYTKLFVGFLPAAILGLLLDDWLEALLQTPMVVGFTLILVGIFLLFMDKWLPGGQKSVDDLSYIDAAKIGLIQSVAMIPGVSRSASSIAGGLFCGMSRVAATEFSFFLAVPTLTAAGGYKLLKNWDSLSSSQLGDIAIGNAVAFVTAAIAVKFFITLVQKRGFAWFGVYRIVAGLAFLSYLWLR